MTDKEILDIIKVLRDVNETIWDLEIYSAFILTTDSERGTIMYDSDMVCALEDLEEGTDLRAYLYNYLEDKLEELKLIINETM